VGYALALIAARTTSAKYILVASNTGHHDHWGAAMLDAVSGRSKFIPVEERKQELFWGHLLPAVFNIDGKKVAFWHSSKSIGVQGMVCPDHTAERHYCVEGLVPGKDWGEMLKTLME
jgi:hypothetical protein